MSDRLVSLDGLAPIPIDRILIVVGRHRRCDVRLGSLHVSERHCCLVRDGRELVVRDLGSVNGTWINGRRVENGRLAPGDELSIAEVRFLLEGEWDAEPARDPSCLCPLLRCATPPIFGIDPERSS